MSHLMTKRFSAAVLTFGLLLVWRGAHSWAMSGFRSDKDPLMGDDFNVEGIYAEDVWYPRISSIWFSCRRPRRRK